MACMTPEVTVEISHARGSRYLELLRKYRNHSIITRMDNAHRAGKDTFDLCRPRNSVKGSHTTDEILELLRLSGCHVEVVPISSVDVVLYRVSNLSLSDNT